MQLHILSAAEEDTLIVVVDGHRERHLGLVLTDDILIQDGTDVLGRGDISLHFRHGVAIVSLLGLGNDTVAQSHALVTNIASGSCDDAFYLFLHFSAKGAAYCSSFFILCHSSSLILYEKEQKPDSSSSPRSLCFLIADGSPGLPGRTLSLHQP